MHPKQLLAAVLAAGIHAAEAKCNGDLQIDNFSAFSSYTNSMNDVASGG